MDTLEEDLEALRLLVERIRNRQDVLRLKADLSALREAARNRTTDTPTLQRSNEIKVRRAAIQSSILTKAALNPEGFVKYVQDLDLFQMDVAFKYADLIEALIIKCAHWRQFLLEELDRVLLAYERSKSPSVFQALQGFAFLEFCRDSVTTDAVRDRFAAALQSNSSAVKLAVLDLFSGFPFSNHVGLRQALSECLFDPDWKVRWRAEDLLTDEQLLPSGYRPRLWDRIRRRFAT